MLRCLEEKERMEDPQIEIILDTVVLPHHNFLNNLIKEEKQRQETLAKIAARYARLNTFEDCLIGRTADEIHEMALEWFSCLVHA